MPSGSNALSSSNQERKVSRNSAIVHQFLYLCLKDEEYIYVIVNRNNCPFGVRENTSIDPKTLLCAQKLNVRYDRQRNAITDSLRHKAHNLDLDDMRLSSTRYYCAEIRLASAH